jgi:serine kinase of HPr protein (carbohydrate metabolism regulator)
VSAGAGPLRLHASALLIGEAGVLIRGPSGVGKSALTLALLDLARERKVFAALIGDDRVEVAAVGGRVIARGVAQAQGLIEQRGLGIVEAQAEPCAVVRLVVDLVGEGQVPRMPEPQELVANLAGIVLPRLIFGAESATIERAYATLRALDKMRDRIMTRLAHFA